MSEKKRRLGRAGWLGGLGVVALPIILGLFHSRRDSESAYLEKSIAAGHETRDLNVRGVALFFVALSIMGAVVLAAATGTMFALSPARITLPYPPASLQDAPVPTLPPEPRLEAVPGQILGNLRTTEDQELNSYGWVDQKSGIVRIPIDRAMDLLLQRGLPTRSDAGSLQDKGDQSPTDASSGRTSDKFP